jgi:hypothetical protein
MTSVSRPLIGLLVATVAFFAVWTLALKPKSSGGGGTSTNAYQSAIDKAHQAVNTSNSASAAHGGSIVTSPSTPATTPKSTATAPTATTATAPAATAPAAHATKPSKATAPAAAKAHPAQTAAQRQAAVAHALRQHKVVALLLFNPKAADDRMVRRELAKVPAHRGRVVKLAVPVGELTRYPIITAQVPITGTPTLVIVDRAQRATTIFGFSSQFEIMHRIDQALTVQPGS